MTRVSKLWSDEQDAILREMWPTGCASADIARATGMGSKQVLSRREQINLPPRHNKRTRISAMKAVPPPTVRRIYRLPDHVAVASNGVSVFRVRTGEGDAR